MADQTSSIPAIEGSVEVPTWYLPMRASYEMSVAIFGAHIFEEIWTAEIEGVDQGHSSLRESGR